jgi:flagellar biosynthesis protein FliR
MPPDLLDLVPAFVLAFFRIAGMMLAAPFFGSALVPRRVKLYLALVLTLGMVPGLAAATLPDSAWVLAAGIGGEFIFGLAIGTALSFVFVAVQWAGEIIGQQIGFGMGAVFDPSMGTSGSMIGDLYFMFTLAIFLIIRGHHAFLRGVRETFDTLPLLSVTMTQDLLELVVGLLQSAAGLAIQLAAPVLLTMLLKDVVLGFLSKTIPQINVMTAGLSMRSLLGLMVLIAGAALTVEVLIDSLGDAMETLRLAW